MKVLLLDATAGRGDALTGELAEMEALLKKEGFDSEIIPLSLEAVRGCTTCGKCGELGRCVFEDQVNLIAEKLKVCDGFVVASPVRMAAVPGELTALLSRLFTSARFDMSLKVGAALAEARPGTLSTTFELNKYLAIAGMPIVSAAPGSGKTGAEGRSEHVRSLTRNMVFLMDSIALGKETFSRA